MSRRKTFLYTGDHQGEASDVVQIGIPFTRDGQRVGTVVDVDAFTVTIELTYSEAWREWWANGGRSKFFYYLWLLGCGLIGFGIAISIIALGLFTTHGN